MTQVVSTMGNLAAMAEHVADAPRATWQLPPLVLQPRLKATALSFLSFKMTIYNHCNIYKKFCLMFI